MKIHKAITPLDGRNYHKIKELVNFFSEFAYTKTRIEVEIQYLEFLVSLGLAKELKKQEIELLNTIYSCFDEKEMNQIKKIESKINHDVKAIEYYIKEKLKTMNFSEYSTLVHWGLTSEDVSNIAYSLQLKSFNKNILMPNVLNVCSRFSELISISDIPMIARTHGQPANITTMAKELAVYLSRIINKLNKLKVFRFHGKISGSVGSYSEQSYSVSDIDWISVNSGFIESLGLKSVQLTTQIIPYENMIEYFQLIHGLNSILIDLVQNLWLYTQLNYFSQKNIIDEVGSSIMPQKINPIYFEGTEGGLQLANSIFSFYATKFPSSRYQRDFSDSTVKRSFGIPFGYTILSLQSLLDGLKRIKPNEVRIKEDLDSHWEIFTSNIQTKQRLEGKKNAYEQQKKYVKGQQIKRYEFEKLNPGFEINLDEITAPCRKLVSSVQKKYKVCLNKKNNNLR